MSGRIGHRGLLMQEGAADPYFANVALLLHMDGSDGSTTLTDSSPLAPQTSTCFGTALSTAAARFGPSSWRNSGTSGLRYAELPKASAIVGSSDFTIELWVNADASQPNGYPLLWSQVVTSMVSNWGAGTLALDVSRVGSTNRMHVYCYNYSTSAALLTGSTNILGAGWVHVALTRSGSSWTLWLNGAVEATGTFSGSVATADADLTPFLGGDSYSGDGSIASYIDDLRVTHGVSRYGAPFTPPAAPHPDY